MALWFRKDKAPRAVRDIRTATSLGEGLFLKCDGCRETLYAKEVERNQRVCPKCGFHFRLLVDERLKLLFDDGTFQPLFADVRPTDALRFRDTRRYRDRLRDYEAKAGRPDAVASGVGAIEGIRALVAALDYAFMGGSMGSVVGEVLTRMAEKACDEKTPLVIVTASGGARMQEGILSLMQMAKISAALARLDAAGLPFVSILTDPTTGGVTAREPAGNAAMEADRGQNETSSPAMKPMPGASMREWARRYFLSVRFSTPTRRRAFGLMLNLRHSFFGLSLIGKVSRLPQVKPYLIFSLTDETYAVLTATDEPEQQSKARYYFFISILNQTYWVVGSLAGGLLGQTIKTDLRGMDFALTALFTVLVIEQYRRIRSIQPFLVAVIVGIGCLILVSPQYMLLISIITGTVIIMLFRKKG